MAEPSLEHSLSDYTGYILNYFAGISWNRLETDNNSLHTGSILIYQRVLAFSWVPWENDYSFLPPLISPLGITSHLTLSQIGHQPTSIFKSLHLSIEQITMLRHRTVRGVWIGEMPTVSSFVFSIPSLCSLWDTQLGLIANSQMKSIPMHPQKLKNIVILCRDIKTTLFGVSWG